MDLMAVYDTTEKIESKTTPDLLAQLLLEHVPQSNSRVSVPGEDDPTGKNWTPHWSDIYEAVAQIERFLSSKATGQMTVDGFATEDLIDELRLLRDELRAASKHTSRFHLCVY